MGASPRCRANISHSGQGLRMRRDLRLDRSVFDWRQPVTTFGLNCMVPAEESAGNVTASWRWRHRYQLVVKKSPVLASRSRCISNSFLDNLSNHQTGHRGIIRNPGASRDASLIFLGNVGRRRLPFEPAPDEPLR